MTDDDDDYLKAWANIQLLYRDFLDGWWPSPDEPGVMLRGSVPYAVKKTTILQGQRRTLH